jgi:hypothetical protein
MYKIKKFFAKNLKIGTHSPQFFKVIFGGYYNFIAVKAAYFSKNCQKSLRKTEGKIFYTHF